jgi:RecB family exonuclease
MNNKRTTLLNYSQSLMDGIIEQLGLQHWDCVILPSLFGLQRVRKRWIKLYGQGILPKMVTYIHPMGYTTPSVLNELPVSLGQGIAWTLDFLAHFSKNTGEMPTSGMPADLAGFARSLLHLWEHMDRCILYDNPDPQSHILWGSEGVCLPAGLLEGACGSGTPRVVQAWLKWWPQWLARHKLCSQTRSTFLAQEYALEWWQKTPQIQILLSIQRGEKTPWRWLKHVASLPNVRILVSDELSWDEPGRLKTVESSNTEVFVNEKLSVQVGAQNSLQSSVLPLHTSADSVLPPHAQVPVQNSTKASVQDATESYFSGLEIKVNSEEITQPVPQSIVCDNTAEQARVIALLVRESLENPEFQVGLIVPCETLLGQITYALKPHGIKLFVPNMPLVTTLLHTIWRGSMASWGRGEVLALLHHPLILRTHPIVTAFAQWIELYPSMWPKKTIKKEGIPSDNLWEGMEEGGATGPRWLRRLHRTIKNATGELTQAIETATTTGIPQSMIFWIDHHLKSLQALVPPAQWDSDVVIEKMLQEQLGALPHMGPRLYGHWLTSWAASLTKLDRSGHGRVIVGTAEDLEFIRPNRCIASAFIEAPLFPWMPKSWSDHFHVPEAKSGVHWPSVHRDGDVWLVSQQPTPTASVYRKWAGAGLNNPSVQRGSSIDQMQVWAKDRALTRPYPPLTMVSISDLQRWNTDPEAFYQERVLRIRSLGVSSQQAWGLAIHALLDHFVRDFPPQRTFSMAELYEGLQALAQLFLPPMPWWQEASRDHLLHNIATCEYLHRQTGLVQSVTEKSGKAIFSLEKGTVALVGRADRIDYLEDGTAHIIDYKTGLVPSFVSLDRMESIQLPLEGLMVQSGAMGLPRPVSKLSWWSLHLTKGCQVKTYPRCVQKLLDPYELMLPKWLNQLASGGYGKCPEKYP